MFKFLKSSFFLCLFFLAHKSNAQLNNEALTESVKVSSENKGNLYFHFNNFNYLRNNEYFNPIVVGETLFGTMIAPTLVYYPTERIRLELGIFTQRDFGDNGFSQVSPFFRLKYQKDSTYFTFGNLQANFAHQMIEPMYAFEQGIRRNLENGVQFQHHKKWFYTDIWIDWQQRTQKNATTQEQIWAGMVAHFELFKTPKFSLKIPLQASALHRGGQDIANATPSATSFNVATGLNFNWDFAEGSFVKQIRSENYLLAAKTPIFDSLTRSITKETLIYSLFGGATYLNLNIKTKWLDMMASWWTSQSYDSQTGGDLYRSIPVYTLGIYQSKRNLLYLRLMKDIKVIDQMYFTLRFEPYYDLINQQMEYSYGLYVNYRPTFLISKIKGVFKSN